ncbi:MAG: outer membrane protein assembly factor BamA [Lentisphaeria bacterium]|nr:outer membrane protein assembly factor BamA [Lentisphaeria bacterium]NQZ67050.1 outer membrane protein assembly factor BamA [Lentisphaeria bacterium]
MKQFFVLLSLFSCLALSAETIEKITIVSLGGHVSNRAVRSSISLRKGQTYNPQRISSDIKKLYATKQYDSITVTVLKTGKETVELTIKIRSKPIIRSIKFKGNKIFSVKKLSTKLLVLKDGLLNDAQMAKDLEEIVDHYHKSGYDGTIVKQSLEYSDKKVYVDVIYNIEEKYRYKIRRVEFIGNKSIRSEKLQELVKTKASKMALYTPLPFGFLKEEKLQEDLDVLRDHYSEQGFLDMKISKVQKLYVKNKVIVKIYLFEGKPYTISKVLINGNELISDEKFFSLLKLKQGLVYHDRLKRNDWKKIVDSYQRFGYLDVRVRPILKVNSANKTIELIYQVKEGGPSRVRDITIVGNFRTHDTVIRRELQIQPGDLSDRRIIDNSERRLLNTGYFESVNVIALGTDDAEKKDLLVKVLEQNTGQLRLGVGVSSDSDFVVTASIQESNFDLFSWPPKGGGQHLSMNMQTGEESQNFNINYIEPWLFDHRLRLKTSLWNSETENNRDWEEQRTGGSISLTSLSPFFEGWRQTFGYKAEDNVIKDIDPLGYSAAFIAAEEREELTSEVSFGMSRDTRNSIRMPQNGYRLSFNTSMQLEDIGSYMDLYKVDVNYLHYWPVFDKSIFKIKSSLNWVEAIDGDDSDIKLFDRYFTGGRTTIRGFEERNVGPIDFLQEEPVGGRSKFLATAEFIKPLYRKKIFGVLFADAGNVWADSGHIDLDELNVTLGFGIRIFFPGVGAVTFDYGIPVEMVQDHLDDNPEFHFSIGNLF